MLHPVLQENGVRGAYLKVFLIPTPLSQGSYYNLCIDIVNHTI